MNKEIKIQVPEGYEIDRENSTFECVKFKPKELTYDDIAKELFLNKVAYFIGTNGSPVAIEMANFNYPELNNAVSRQQCERLLAINQLMNVAYYFNEIVDKDLTFSPFKYIIMNDVWDGIHVVASISQCKSGLVRFKTAKSAEKAIKILGKETVKLAISL